MSMWPPAPTSPAPNSTFPAPQRHDEGDFKWAGYDYPVALPVTFTLKTPGDPAIIDADVFLGVCETICIPVKTKLTLDPASDPDNPDDAAAVSAALAALPEKEQADFGVKVVSKPGDTIVVLEASFPGDPASAELFIAGDEDYTFTTPEKIEKDGKTLFSVEVGRPARRRHRPRPALHAGHRQGLGERTSSLFLNAAFAAALDDCRCVDKAITDYTTTPTHRPRTSNDHFRWRQTA